MKEVSSRLSVESFKDRSICGTRLTGLRMRMTVAHVTSIPLRQLNNVLLKQYKIFWIIETVQNILESSNYN